MAMSSHNISPLGRIPHLVRPLRPPNTRPRPRHFTQNSYKFLLSSPPPRPQLPYLHSPISNRLARVTLQTQISRLISTERKAQLKRIARWQFRFHLFFWPAVFLVAVSGASARQLLLEQEYPTPPDWSIWSRWIMRNRKEAEFSEETRHGAINWAFLGEGYLQLLERLEKGPDSKGIKELDEGGMWVEGIGRTGYDVNAKSGPWKQGYYEALMGTARVAENLDGWVKHKDGKGGSYPREMIPGPANPHPAPPPANWKGRLPAMEDCVSAFDSPAIYYTRILTTQGFTTRMKTDAALAWAEWLDFKGLHETAEEVLKWGMDIAATGMKLPHLSDVVDTKTGAFKSRSPGKISENMLKSTTALAVHYARAGRTDKALPIMLSIMKTRNQMAPSMQLERSLPWGDPGQGEMGDWMFQLFRGPKYPPLPSSGDDPPMNSLKEACEQTGIMTYIGEILYATSSRSEGLSWTRDAVDGAEAVLEAMEAQGVEDGKEKCEECLETGLLNWQMMANLLALQQEQKSNTSWFGRNKETEREKWSREQDLIEERIRKMKPIFRSRFGQKDVVPLDRE